MINEFQSSESQPLPRPSLLTANLWYMIAASGQVILPLIALLLMKLPVFQGSTAALNSALNTFYEIALIALPAAMYAFRNRTAALPMRLKAPDARMVLYAAALAIIGVLMANDLTTWWLLLIDFFGGTPQASGIAVPADAPSLLQSILLIGVIPGVCEELLFRSGLIGAWEARGRKTALLVSTVLFALLHGTIAGLPNQLIMGFVLGYILILSGSVFVSMTYHIIHNSFTLLIAYLSSQVPAAEIAVDPYADLSGYVASSVGYESLLMHTAIMVLLFMLILWGMISHAKRCKRDISLVGSVNEPTEFLPPLTHFLPLIAALGIIALNYASDFIATFM